MTNYTFVSLVRFLSEKRNKTYMQYDEVSIAREKRARAQKAFQLDQLCWAKRKAGVYSS
jgi:hypothetical protein